MLQERVDELKRVGGKDYLTANGFIISFGQDRTFEEGLDCLDREIVAALKKAQQ